MVWCSCLAAVRTLCHTLSVIIAHDAPRARHERPAGKFLLQCSHAMAFRLCGPITHVHVHASLICMRMVETMPGCPLRGANQLMGAQCRVNCFASLYMVQNDYYSCCYVLLCCAACRIPPGTGLWVPVMGVPGRGLFAQWSAGQVSRLSLLLLLLLFHGRQARGHPVTRVSCYRLCPEAQAADVKCAASIVDPKCTA